MRNRLWLILWLLGISFPMAFLGSIWPAFGRLFNTIFAPIWMHVLMHAFLYPVLAFMLTFFISPPSIHSSMIILSQVFLAGCIHEGLQIIIAAQWPGASAEIFDLSVDLSGAIVALGLARFISHRTTKEFSTRLPKSHSSPGH